MHAVGDFAGCLGAAFGLTALEGFGLDPFLVALDPGVEFLLGVVAR